MKEIKNQRGFSTLEIILVVSIIGIFSTVAVPKMTRLVDKVCLDYEMKHLYSDLNLARLVGKSSTFNGGIFPDIEDAQPKVEFWIYGKNYSTATARNHYQFMCPSVSSYPQYRHNLTNGIELEFNRSDSVKKITFNNPSRYSSENNTALTLKSKFGNSAYIIFDSVGRWRGSYEK